MSQESESLPTSDGAGTLAACGRCRVPVDPARTCVQAGRTDGGCPTRGACPDCVSLAAQCAAPPTDIEAIGACCCSGCSGMGPCDLDLGRSEEG